MKVQPISIREPEIRELIAGAMTALIRPIGRLATLGPGDLLWVREPFLLHQRFNGHAPTAAATLGAAPTFVTDLPIRAPLPAELGRRRHARELPKAWHRQHLVIASIMRLQLHDVADRDLRTAGWKSRSAFATRWDQDARFPDQRLTKQNFWAANPWVLRIQFTRAAKPLTAAAASSLAKPGPAIVNRPSPREARERGVAGGFIDRSPCPRCGTRRDRGCDHYPLSAEV